MSDQGAKKILVVEDSKTQAQMLRLTLESNSYEVEVAYSGEDALELLKTYQPDMIISDVMMPGIDGYEFCQKVTSTRGKDDFIIIILTSLSQTKDVIKALESGADYFMTKPCEDDYLIERVAAAFKQREAPYNPEDQEISLLIDGEKHVIKSDKRQIINLLISTYDAAVLKNQLLIDATKELKELNDDLETIVEKRTEALRKELEDKKSS